jgi:hypothetical protein
MLDHPSMHSYHSTNRSLAIRKKQLTTQARRGHSSACLRPLMDANWLAANNLPIFQQARVDSGHRGQRRGEPCCGDQPSPCNATRPLGVQLTAFWLKTEESFRGQLNAWPNVAEHHAAKHRPTPDGRCM